MMKAFKRSLELGRKQLECRCRGKSGWRETKKPAYSKVKNDDRTVILMILFSYDLRYSNLPFLKLIAIIC